MNFQARQDAAPHLLAQVRRKVVTYLAEPLREAGHKERERLDRLMQDLADAPDSVLYALCDDYDIGILMRGKACPVCPGIMRLKIRVRLQQLRGLKGEPHWRLVYGSRRRQVEIPCGHGH